MPTLLACLHPNYPRPPRTFDSNLQQESHGNAHTVLACVAFVCLGVCACVCAGVWTCRTGTMRPTVATQTSLPWVKTCSFASGGHG